ncbi:MAG: selenium-binding protein, partial [Gammaproteobacteria bacterium]|nr:selenium-binding protein [Gammaproteobacteria bacterium]
MALWKPDPTFYPSPRMAMQAPPETLAYVAAFNPTADGRPDAMTVVDLAPDSPSYGRLVGEVPMPNAGDELHHFGWNACSSALCPYAPHPHIERRYLVVPGLRSSRIHIIDIKPDPRSPKLVKTIEPEDVFKRAPYSRFHTIHCGPEGIYISALGSQNGDGPGGIFLLDHFSFDVLGQWEMERGPQYLAYDFWWHLAHDTMITSEWGTPNMIENGLVPDLLLNGKYGRRVHVWDLRRRRHVQALDLGPEQQLVLELRAAHDPTKTYGFVGVVISLKDLSSSIWLWHRDNGEWKIQKIIEIPAERADPEHLPPLLQGFKAVPPLVTDINLSLDDRWLYVSCWGTGELRQYDVSDPFKPRLTGSVHLGGIVRRTPHPKHPDQPLSGAPQMVEVSRDGKRVYFTNSLYHAWDEQFYPEGMQSWMVKLDA